MDICTKTPGVGSHREMAWKEMITRTTFTVGEVASAVGIERNKVSTFVQFLLKKNRLATVKSQRPYKFKVLDNTPLAFGKGQRAGEGIKSHRKGNKPRQRMWNTMRVMRVFTVLDLMMAAEVQRNTAHTYLMRLKRAGYVRVTKPGGNRHGERAIYLLVRNSGPKSPIDKGEGGMWDINDQQLHLFHKEAADE